MKSRLIGLVYSALLGETTWQYFLDELALAIPDGRAGLVVHDTSSNNGYMLVGEPDEIATDSYNTHFARLNPLQPALALRAIGSGACDYELVPRNQLVRTEFHNDYLVPHGMSHSGGVKFANVGTQSFVVFAACGSKTAGPIQQSLGLLTDLAPHLARAIGHYRSGTIDRNKRMLSAALAEAANISIIVINDEKQSRFISASAHGMLQSTSLLHISLDDRVSFRKPGIQVAFESMLNRHYDGPTTLNFNLKAEGRLSLVRVEANSASTYFEGPTIIAMLETSSIAPSQKDLQLLIDTYKLSMGESRALLGIANGMSIMQIAAQASLSVETIRSQIKSLYVKTGAESKMDIIRILYRRSLPT